MNDRVRGFRSRAILSLGALLLTALGAVPAHAQSFPFGRELLLDANPMRGTRRIPSIDIGERGTADIDLWCNTVKAQLIIAANTITIITGEATNRQCNPDVLRADDDLLAALNQVTTWRMDNEALILTGGRTLRFRVQTN